MRHVVTEAENYVVCGRADVSDSPIGSVREHCFACNHFVTVYPSSQQLLAQRIDLHIKIVCNSCYLRAPDKDHIQPIELSGMPVEMTNRIQRTIRSFK